MRTPSARRRQAPSEHHELHVCDGRTLIGKIVERGRKITAYTANGRRIGTFKNRRAAVRAIPARGQ